MRLVLYTLDFLAQPPFFPSSLPSCTKAGTLKVTSPRLFYTTVLIQIRFCQLKCVHQDVENGAKAEAVFLSTWGYFSVPEVIERRGFSAAGFSNQLPALMVLRDNWWLWWQRFWMLASRSLYCSSWCCTFLTQDFRGNLRGGSSLWSVL